MANTQRTNELFGKLFQLYGKRDNVYGEPSYRRYFENILEANMDLITSMTDPKQKQLKLEQIDAEAFRLSQEQTFRTSTEIYKQILKLGNRNLGAKLVLDSFLPFARTMINITTYGIKRSPIGWFTGLSKLVSYKGYDPNNPFYIYNAFREINQGTMGTLLMGLGFMLASVGFIDIEKEDEGEDDIGMALRLGGIRIGLEQFAPAILPILVGGAMFEGSGDIGNLLDKMLLPVGDTTMIGQLDYILKK